MASIPCLKSESRCSPCAEDNPFANLSLEPADRNIWLSVYFGSPRNVTPNTWTTDACVGFCESAISQTDADDCARRRAEDCVITDVTDDPPPPDPPISPALFCNQETSCVSGSNCYTLPACTVFAGSQAEADAIAQSLCNSRVLDPAQSSPCVPVPPAPPPPPPTPPVPCVECCNCGTVVQIESYTPSLFVFDPALLDVNDATDACNTPPVFGTRNLSNKTFSVIDNGWLFCTGQNVSTNHFFKQFGSWFAAQDAGFCPPTPPFDGQVLVRPLQAYPAGEPFDGAVTLKHNPYDLGFGTGAWDGKFALTDDSFVTCAVQNFSAKHINGFGGFTVQLDQSGSGPSAIWTLSIKRYYVPGDFGGACSATSLADLWIGEHTGETQCGAYSKTGGDFFTGPASLNIVGVA